MQERELAHRIVHFLPDEIVFQCRSYARCECDGIPDPLSFETSAFSSLRHNVPKRRDDRFVFGIAWAKVLMEHSRLAITHESDVLPALSGIARHVEAQYNPGEYIAGFWARDVVYQLGWYSRKDHSRTRRTLGGPTFAWTAANGMLKWPPGTPIQSLCDFVLVDSELATRNPYGATARCRILLQCRLVSGTNMAAYMSRPNSDAKLMVINLDARNDAAFRDKGIAQWVKHAGDLAGVACLSLYWEQRTGSDGKITRGVVGLLVRRGNGEGEWARIGVALNVPIGMFEDHGAEECVWLV
jgi:hypothetical protein